MPGSLGVMTVVLLETAAGGAVVLWASGVWGHVRRGFFLLMGIAIALCAVGAALLARTIVADAPAQLAASEQAVLAQTEGALAPSGTLIALAGAAGDRLVLGLAVFAGLLVLWQALLLVRSLERAAHAVGLAAAVAGVIGLVLLGLARQPDAARAIAELALGAVFLGSSLFGLLLGHWYLVERKLSNRYMIRSSWWYIAGCAAAFAAVGLSALNPPEATSGTFNPLLAVPSFSLLLGGGLAAICALIAGFVWKLAQEGGRSIQAATGMFYLAVIMAFSAELSTKFRFF